MYVVQALAFIGAVTENTDLQQRGVTFTGTRIDKHSLNITRAHLLLTGTTPTNTQTAPATAPTNMPTGDPVAVPTGGDSAVSTGGDLLLRSVSILCDPAFNATAFLASGTPLSIESPSAAAAPGPAGATDSVLTNDSVLTDDSANALAPGAVVQQESDLAAAEAAVVREGPQCKAKDTEAGVMAAGIGAAGMHGESGAESGAESVVKSCAQCSMVEYVARNQGRLQRYINQGDACHRTIYLDPGETCAPHPPECSHHHW